MSTIPNISSGVEYQITQYGLSKEDTKMLRLCVKKYQNLALPYLSDERAAIPKKAPSIWEKSIGILQKVSHHSVNNSLQRMRGNTVSEVQFAQAILTDLIVMNRLGMEKKKSLDSTDGLVDPSTPEILGLGELQSLASIVEMSTSKSTSLDSSGWSYGDYSMGLTMEVDGFTYVSSEIEALFNEAAFNREPENRGI